MKLQEKKGSSNNRKTVNKKILLSDLLKAESKLVRKESLRVSKELSNIEEKIKG